MSVEEYSKPENVILTFNDELDRRIGGLPIPTLFLIDGENGSGKSVLVQQITYGALRMGYRVLYITTENTVEGLIKQMEGLSFNVIPYFIAGRLTIYTIHTKGTSWEADVARLYLTILKNVVTFTERHSLIVIDSITHFFLYSTEEDILEFLSRLRSVVDSTNKSVFITIHSHALPSELLYRVKSICDGNITLTIKELRDKVVRFINVNKLRGATKTISTLIGFEIDPAFGIKVIPLSIAKA